MNENFEVPKEKLPRHVAIILDGNGRYAKAHGLPRSAGHKAGADNVETIADAIVALDIHYMTVYAFSTENWKRSKEEVSYLMTLLSWYLDSYVEKALKSGIRVRVIGDRTGLSETLQKKIAAVEEKTKDQTNLHLTFAINYGGRDEITRGAVKMAQAIANGDVDGSQVTESVFGSFLDTADLPDPDLLIRTSGEERISNFLLWQIAYSELYFCDKYWPEFTMEDLKEAVRSYAKRNRRYGARNPKEDQA